MEQIESKWENIEILPSQVIDVQYIDDNFVEITTENNAGAIEVHSLITFAATKLFRMTGIHKKDVHKRWEEFGGIALTDTELLKAIQFRQANDTLILRKHKSSGEIKSVVGKGYVPVDMEELEMHAIETLVQGGMSDYSIDRYKATYARDHDVSRFVLRNLKRPTPKVGDIMSIGLQIKNNELGTRGISVCLYMERLACSNGMCMYNTEEAITATHLNDKDSILVRFDEACTRIIDRAWNALEQIDRCASVDLTYAEMDLILDRMVISKRISGKISSVIRDSISSGSYGPQDQNLWTLVSGITGVASHQASHGVKTELEYIASELVKTRSKSTLDLQPVEARPVLTSIEV